jgi:hypothetical protein
MPSDAARAGARDRRLAHALALALAALALAPSRGSC